MSRFKFGEHNGPISVPEPEKPKSFAPFALDGRSEFVIVFQKINATFFHCFNLTSQSNLIEVRYTLRN
ncbi:hypothetical protein G9P44_004843 [Scheffersomyces stipitis]|nr:hypothetical protein G9P44_004843 [Scheffersomyces stipitis]